MKCKHEDFEYIKEESYIDSTVREYRCVTCKRVGFHNQPHANENNICWEDSL
jgi:hypothetical protein